jgi:hypothetical protein
MTYRTYMTYLDGFIPPHGNYRQLLSYRKAEIVFDITYRFCQRFLAKSDRTIDQMIQGARSGKQNILEGSKASGTSKETEIKLMGVAPCQFGRITRRLPRRLASTGHAALGQRES